MRTFDESDTVFAANFAHASASLGTLDYYFADATVVPALGSQVATLSFGEMSDTADYAEGNYVLTITTAGDPNDVVFISGTTSYTARDTFLLTSFDGDLNDTAPVFVRAFGGSGGTAAIPDVNFPPTIQFLNASMDLGASDIYDDEMLTSLRVANHDFLDVSAELDIAVGTLNLFYTPTGDTSAISLESTFTAFGGIRYRTVATGMAGSLAAVTSVPDIAPVETHAKILPFQASNNFPFLDLYVVAPDVPIDDVAPIRRALASGEVSLSGALPAGTYDIYVTETGEKVVLAGPYRVTAAIGDVVDLLSSTPSIQPCSMYCSCQVDRRPDWCTRSSAAEIFSSFMSLKRQCEHCFDAPAQSIVSAVEVTVGRRVRYSPMHRDRGCRSRWGTIHLPHCHRR